MNAFLVLCLLLRAVSPAFVESTDALFADFHVDAALIGRLWKPFLALDPVDRTAFAAHHELVTARLSAHFAAAVRFFELCFKTAPNTIDALPEEPETPRSNLFAVLGNLSLLFEAAGGAVTNHHVLATLHRRLAADRPIVAVLPIVWGLALLCAHPGSFPSSPARLNSAARHCSSRTS